MLRVSPLGDLDLESAAADLDLKGGGDASGRTDGLQGGEVEIVITLRAPGSDVGGYGDLAVKSATRTTGSHRDGHDRLYVVKTRVGIAQNPASSRSFLRSCVPSSYPHRPSARLRSQQPAGGADDALVGLVGHLG